MQITASPSIKSFHAKSRKTSRSLPSLVFVYGTLKRKGHNNWRLRGAAFVGTGVTVSRYPLICATLPYLLPFKDVGKNVQGELYTVPHWMLRQLDALEGHPDWYKREVIPVLKYSVSVTPVILQAWTYFYQHCHTPPKELPFLSSYQPGGKSAPLSEL